MVWVFFLVVVVIVSATLAALVLGRISYDPMAPATHTHRDVTLPTTLKAGDIDDVRFDTALRGYRMDQVDAVLDQLQERLRQYEAQHESATIRLPKSRPARPPQSDQSLPPA